MNKNEGNMKGEKFLLSQNIGFRTDLYLSTEDYSNIGKGSLQKKISQKMEKVQNFLQPMIWTF